MSGWLEAVWPHGDMDVLNKPVQHRQTVLVSEKGSANGYGHWELVPDRSRVGQFRLSAGRGATKSVAEKAIEFRAALTRETLGT